MNNDPIVTEVRRIRDELARHFDYDIHAIFADLRSRQQVDDPAHPLVQNACGDEFAGGGSLVLHEEPPEYGKKKD